MTSPRPVDSDSGRDGAASHQNGDRYRSLAVSGLLKEFQTVIAFQMTLAGCCQLGTNGFKIKLMNLGRLQ